MSWVGTSGYAVAAQGYLLALVAAGESVGWTPLFPRDPEVGGWSRAESTAAARSAIGRYCDDNTDPDAYNGATALAAVDQLGDDEADAAILHTVPEAWQEHRGGEALTVGNTVWETDKLPGHWRPLLNKVDRLIVPCQLNREVMVQSGVTTPIHVVPHVAPRLGLEHSEAERNAFRQSFGIPEGGTVFYCCDEWNPRKAPYKTIGAFLAAFSGDDDVTLVLKTGSYGPRSGTDQKYHTTSELASEIIRTHPNPPKVIVIGAELPRRAIDLLHGIGDCYLSLTHGEGWGLGAYEATASGNPVITTGWGGTLDYLGTEWPYLVNYEMVPVMYLSGMPSFDPTQSWAAADQDHAVALMHEVMNDPKAARLAADKVRERIYSENDLVATAERLAKAIAR